MPPNNVHMFGIILIGSALPFLRVMLPSRDKELPPWK